MGRKHIKLSAEIAEELKISYGLALRAAAPPFPYSPPFPHVTLLTVLALIMIVCVCVCVLESDKGSEIGRQIDCKRGTERRAG